ncbi:hypothetical protein [Marichromatium bheemlicum]|uniref:HMA domain-containing protein n=1 Tax=Marichromatium bheemlicum TaxID=365339 RepID=A0ABX1I373_9GAMM|nr:hypothetical protein [Marichromatium bheemlicum]NKN31957.1 hypothetical protein [Marichromatium bheemlicum]
MPSAPTAHQGQLPPFSICHQVPGRLRLRVPLLLAEPGTGRTLSKALRDLPGVMEVRCNPACASLVVEHHPHHPLDADAISSTLTPLIHQSRPAAVLAPHRTRKPTTNAKSPSRRSPRSRLRGDCPLCRLKLQAARWIMADVWRCWRDRTQSRIRALMVTALSPLRH